MNRNKLKIWTWITADFKRDVDSYKIEFKKYPNLAIDFYLAVYYSVILKKFYIHRSHLTYYRQVADGTESSYLKFKSKKWWSRRNEAFKFLNNLLVKNKLPPNRSLDYFVTKFLNQFFDLIVQFFHQE